MLYNTDSNLSSNLSGTMDLTVHFSLREWILLVGLSLMILCVVFGNFLILAAVFKHRPLQTPPVYLIASLAVADLMVGLMVMPISLTKELTLEWKLGVAVCKIWISLDVMCCTASILNLCVIALDRFWAITKPLGYKRTLTRMLIMIAVVWGISIVISTSLFIGWRTEIPDPLTCMISQNQVYTIFSTFGAFFIPMTIMLVVYARIFVEARKRIHGKTNLTQTLLGSSCRLSKSRSTVDFPGRISSFLRSTGISSSEPHIGEMSSTSNVSEKPSSFIGSRRRSNPSLPKPDASFLLSQTNKRFTVPSSIHNHKSYTSLYVNQSQDRGNQVKLTVSSSPIIQRCTLQRRQLASAREQKAVKTLAIVTGTFLVCWLPFFITALVVPFCQQCHLPAFWKSLFLWLGYFNSMVNPILYTKFNKDFKDAFRKLLHCPRKNTLKYRPVSPNRVRKNEGKKQSPSPQLPEMNGQVESLV